MGYVDANGLLQTVHYVADPINGFRVAATNLPVAGNAAPLVAPVHVTEPLVAPVHETEPLIAPLPVEETPEVAAARAEHLALVAEATAAAAAAPEERKKRETEAGYGRKKRDADAEPIDAGYGIPAAPIVRIAPVVHVPAPVLPAQAPLVHHAIPHAPVVHAIPQHHHIGHTIAAPATPFHAAPFVNHAPLVHSVPAPIAPARFTVPAPAAPAPFSFPAPVAAPVPIFSSPIAHAALPAPLVAPSSQFHAQDEFGQFSFGHQSINQARTESRDAFGVTRGSYQYVDANGLIQTVQYIADPVNGFRVAATNLPVAGNAAPLVAPVHVTEPLVAPVH